MNEEERIKQEIKTARENLKKNTAYLEVLNEELRDKLFLLKVKVSKLNSLDSEEFFLESEMILDEIKELKEEAEWTKRV